MSQWREMYAAVERTYSDAALLLQDAEGLLEERGLQVTPSNKTTVGGEGSAMLARPSWWFYGWVSRHFGRRPLATPNDARWYVAVLFCKRDGDDYAPLDEPVVTAGLLSHPNWEYWVAKAWAWNPNRTADGTVFDRRVKHGAIDSTIRCFAHPISAVGSTDALRTLIIDPLLAIERP